MKIATDTRLRMRCGAISPEEKNDLIDDLDELEDKLKIAIAALEMIRINCVRGDVYDWAVKALAKINSGHAFTKVTS